MVVGALGAGEEDPREQPSVVQLGRVGGHAEIVAAESYTDIGSPQLVVHVVVVPECFSGGEMLAGDALSGHSGIRNV